VPSPNLNEVTDAIARLIEETVSRLLNGITVNVSKLPPEKAEEAGDTRLNVYLYHVAQDMDGGNDLVRGGPAGPVPVATRPLALKLYYVLTAHAMLDTVEDVSGQQTLMGWAMKALHDNPVIDAQLVVEGVQIFPSIGDQELQVVLRPVTPEEAVSFWATDQVRTARLSAYYEVSTLLLPPEAPSTTPGVTSQVMLSVVPAGRPTLRATGSVVRFVLPAALGGAGLAPARSPAVVALKATVDADTVVTAAGQGLGDGRDAAVVLRGESTSGLGLAGDAVVLRAADNPGWGIVVTDTEVRFSVRPTAQASTPAGVQAVDVLPGSYTLAVRRSVETRSESGQSGSVDVESNRQPFAVAPYVVTVALDVNDHVVVTVDATYDATATESVPQLSIGGDVYRLVGTFAGTPADAGSFLVLDDHSYEAVPLFDTTLLGRTYPVRVSVNGVDSQPFWLEVA
jgi:Pvc16 N-terminal domain